MLTLDLLLTLLALPLVASCCWLLVLTVLSWRPRLPPEAQAPPMFDIVVPAHDEAAGIASTVKSLLALDWPHDRRRVVVVADNCTDDTAQRARAAGATVLERHSATHKGKGYALQHAFERLEGDAVVVVDADTQVSPNLLRAFAARMAKGAQAIQAYYGVDNASASWRTTLMAIAFAMFHRVRGRARENLHLSCGLKGNGMCFTRALLEKVPHHAFSVVEDLEFGIRLGLAGERVWYVDEAQVRGEMVSGEAASRSQRVRWESGRKAMVRAHLLPLLREAVKRQSPVLLDLAMDLVIPPLSYLGLGAVGVLAVATVLSALTGFPFGLLLTAGGMAVTALGLHLARGWALSETGARGAATLATAPLYVLWKVALMRKQAAAPGEWVRTRRQAEEEAQP
ncbi:MAG: glycosyltransferase [Archangiaceae bacterium]|nr:glycosyltransferase [Archangiaceae bacterium]